MPKRNQTAKVCYVIMPFSKTKACTEEEWTEIFEAVIKPAVEAAGLGYQCLRSEATTGNIIKKVVNSLYHANVVIADLTDRNPNVFYELGVRHTLKNRTIMIAQRRKDIPSDLHGYASHVYKWKTTAQRESFARKLTTLLHGIEEDVDRSDNPVSDFLTERSLSVFEFRKEENLLKLSALRAETGLVSGRLDLLLKTGQEDDDRLVPRLTSPALDHLIATQYVFHPTFAAHVAICRSQLEIAGGQTLKRKSVEALKTIFDVLRQNIVTLEAAYEAGDPVESLEFMDPWDRGRDSSAREP